MTKLVRPITCEKMPGSTSRRATWSQKDDGDVVQRAPTEGWSKTGKPPPFLESKAAKLHEELPRLPGGLAAVTAALRAADGDVPAARAKLIIGAAGPSASQGAEAAAFSHHKLAEAPPRGPCEWPLRGYAFAHRTK